MRASAGTVRPHRPGAHAPIPLPARVLGLGGLLPFAFGAVMVWCPVEPMADLGTRLLGTYAALILSFLGGVRWGALLDDAARLGRWLPLGLSVLPSLVAWAALLLPAGAMFALLGVGLALQYLSDRDASESGVLPAWYGRLRLMLTVGAVIAVLSGLVARLVVV